jgi:hypothetical protein
MNLQKEVFCELDDGFCDFCWYPGVNNASGGALVSWTITVAELECKGLTTFGVLATSSSMFWDFLNQDHFLWSETRTPLRRGDAGYSSIESSSQGLRQYRELIDVAPEATGWVLSSSGITPSLSDEGRCL